MAASSRFDSSTLTRALYLTGSDNTNDNDEDEATAIFGKRQCFTLSFYVQGVGSSRCETKTSDF